MNATKYKVIHKQHLQNLLKMKKLTSYPQFRERLASY